MVTDGNDADMEARMHTVHVSDSEIGFDETVYAGSFTQAKHLYEWWFRYIRSSQIEHGTTIRLRLMHDGVVMRQITFNK